MTRTPLAEGRAVVSVSYRQFHIIVDLEPIIDPPPTAAYTVNPLVVLGEGGVMIVKTGIHTGEVTVIAQAHSAEPSPDDSWEESTEVTVEAVPSTQTYGTVLPLEARRAEMTVVSMDNGNTGIEDLPVLNPGGPGLYRVRISARNRKIIREAGMEDEEPTETYLIQVWPELRAGEWSK